MTAVVCGLYPIREPDQANLAPMKVGRLCCMAERGIGHFEVALIVQTLTDIKRTKIQEWKATAMPKGHGADFSIIGKFMQRSKAEGKKGDAETFFRPRRTGISRE